MNTFDVIVLFIAFIFVAFGVFFFLQYYPVGTPVQYQVRINQSVANTLPWASSQFYPNMRYPSTDITYSMDPTCNIGKTKNIKGAFQILESKTPLKFIQKDSGGEISITCSGTAPQSGDSGHYIAGEGGPKKVINTTRFNVILSGQVLLFKTGDCQQPNIALHEVLHALGFTHNKNESSIMYPITGCDKKLDNYIVQDLDELYSIPSEPDLTITDAKASRTGSFLDFTAKVANEGLVSSSLANISIYAGGKKIKSFSLGNITIGSTRILNVQNVRLPGFPNTIILKVQTPENEISTSNNIATLQHIEQG